MSDSKKIPGAPPPDDFSKTTPNINVPQDDAPTDWDKTNYNFPKQPQADEWGKTIANIKPIDTAGQDFDKTFFPGAQKPSTPDWGVTEPRIDMSQADVGSRPEDFGGAPAGEQYGKTTPYFKLPDAEREKYQNIPPTPAQQAAQAKEEEKAKGGVPAWVWGCGAMSVLFFFTVAVLGVVYFFILRDSGFEVTVKDAPVGSEIRIDGVQSAVSNEDGSYRLLNLKAGEREITISHPAYTCKPITIKGGDGVNPPPVTAVCSQIPVRPDEDCTNIRLGEEDKAERCYNAALDALPDPFTAEDLVKALNILIINFDSGSFKVPDKRLAALQKGAGFIRKLPPNIRLEVGGHTDNDGEDAPNQTLSENRANAVKATLVRFGVAPDALQTRGYGEARPKTDNSTDQGKFYNRRIEYSVIK